MADIDIASSDSPTLEIAASEPVAVDIDVPAAPSLNIGSVAVSLPGTRGEDGNNGKSAYQIAVDNGFVGTEREWLKSLRGEDGRPGPAADTSQLVTLGSYQNITARKSFVRGMNIGEDYGVTLESRPIIDEEAYDGTANLSLSDPFSRDVIISGVKPPSRSNEVANKEYVDSMTVPFIQGTQTTNTGNWTGNAPFAELKNGQQIMYWLPKDGSGSASLQLTLRGGAKTANIPVYRSREWRLTTHYPRGSFIPMIYLVNPVGGQTGWYCIADYDSNTYWQLRHSNAIHMKGAVNARQILVGDGAGYEAAKPGVVFDISYPILTISENRPINTDSAYTFIALDGVDLRVTKPGYAGASRKMAYLVCTIDGLRATVAPEVIVNDIPQINNGKVYIPIGVHYSNTHIYFRSDREMYHYRNSKVGRYSD